MKMQNSKLNKNILSILILAGMFFVFSFSQANAYTENHYVTQGGNGARNGRSLADAWALSDFHNMSNWSTSKAVDRKIGPDDVVYFSGNFTNTVMVTKGGSPAGPITLDGYQPGDCDPLNAVCTGSAVLQQGMDVGGNAYGPDYLTIQDFRITRSNSMTAAFRYAPYRDSSVPTEKSIDYCIFRRNYVYLANGNLFNLYGGQYHIIEDNKFFGFGQNNSDPACGVWLSDMSNSVFRRNEVGHDENQHPSGCTSAEMIELHCNYNVLLEYNNVYGAPQQSGIRPKECKRPMTNVIIRFNKVHGNTHPTQGKGIYCRTDPVQWGADIQNVYIYGNNVFNNGTANLMFGSGVHNVYAWSNILSAGGRNGLWIWNSTVQPSNLHFYNNTIAYNNTSGETDSSRGGMSLGAGDDIHIKNNLLWNNRPGGGGGKYNQLYSTRTISALEHNSYYHSSSNPNIFYYGGAYRTLATMKSNYNFEKNSPAGEFQDPKFTDPNGADNIYGTADDNYKLSADSIVKNNGKPLAGNFSVNLSNGDQWFKNQTGYDTLNFGLDDALDPQNTDWTANPPQVKTIKQTSANWTRGAYAYTSSANIPGDFNGDNKVNTLDYEIMKEEFLKVLPSYRADMNGKDGVNDLDYELFRREFGKKK